MTSFPDACWTIKNILAPEQECLAFLGGNRFSVNYMPLLKSLSKSRSICDTQLSVFERFDNEKALWSLACWLWLASRGRRLGSRVFQYLGINCIALTCDRKPSLHLRAKLILVSTASTGGAVLFPNQAKSFGELFRRLHRPVVYSRWTNIRYGERWCCW